MNSKKCYAVELRRIFGEPTAVCATKVKDYADDHGIPYLSGGFEYCNKPGCQCFKCDEHRWWQAKHCADGKGAKHQVVRRAQLSQSSHQGCNQGRQPVRNVSLPLTLTKSVQVSIQQEEQLPSRPSKSQSPKDFAVQVVPEDLAGKRKSISAKRKARRKLLQKCRASQQRSEEPSQ